MRGRVRKKRIYVQQRDQDAPCVPERLNFEISKSLRHTNTPVFFRGTFVARMVIQHVFSAVHSEAPLVVKRSKNSSKEKGSNHCWMCWHASEDERNPTTSGITSLLFLPTRASAEGHSSAQYSHASCTDAPGRTPTCSAICRFRLQSEVILITITSTNESEECVVGSLQVGYLTRDEL